MQTDNLKRASEDLVDCRTQLTLMLGFVSVPWQIPVRNMKEHSREICLWRPRGIIRNGALCKAVQMWQLPLCCRTKTHQGEQDEELAWRLSTPISFLWSDENRFSETNFWNWDKFNSTYLYMCTVWCVSDHSQSKTLEYHLVTFINNWRLFSSRKSFAIAQRDIVQMCSKDPRCHYYRMMCLFIAR